MLLLLNLNLNHSTCVLKVSWMNSSYDLQMRAWNLFLFFKLFYFIDGDVAVSFLWQTYLLYKDTELYKSSLQSRDQKICLLGNQSIA